MYRDRIVEEIHRIRSEYAESFGNDVHAICESFRNAQARSGHKVVSRPSRKPAETVRPLAVAERQEQYDVMGEG
jgi:hypothetical protein